MRLVTRVGIIGIGTCVLAFLFVIGGDGRSRAAKAETASTWDKIASVLQHPRCMNCHQLETPLQGDARRVHIPPVRRGANNMGVGSMRCHNCHNDSGNNPMSGVPGAPHWQLAPTSMLWEGLSTAELCRNRSSSIWRPKSSFFGAGIPVGSAKRFRSPIGNSSI
jgi:hypothetical protein